MSNYQVHIWRVLSINSEQILVPIIFYEKMKDGINIYFEPNLINNS